MTAVKPVAQQQRSATAFDTLAPGPGFTRQRWLTFIKYNEKDGGNNDFARCSDDRINGNSTTGALRRAVAKGLNMTTAGFVSLVGSGPGDPDLLTLKALRRIEQAEVVVYDRLVSDEILQLVPQGIGRISVGKAPGNHCVPQPQINEMLVGLARSGRRVVRLKGGDPYIFGRGGEEALALYTQGIDFEVIPGVTAAAGCSSYAGIPLTHRGLAHGVRFITGQLQEGDERDINWRCIADPGTTLVIYMGLANLQRICDRLQGAGLPAATPAAAIHEGTTPRQQKVVATLSTLAETVAEAGLDSPVTTIVGEVVSLADRLDWFGRSRCPEDGQDSDDARGRFRA